MTLIALTKQTVRIHMDMVVKYFLIRYFDTFDINRYQYIGYNMIPHHDVSSSK